jgi:hypothetical protein
VQIPQRLKRSEHDADHSIPSSGYMSLWRVEGRFSLLSIRAVATNMEVHAAALNLLGVPDCCGNVLVTGPWQQLASRQCTQVTGPSTEHGMI